MIVKADREHKPRGIVSLWGNFVDENPNLQLELAEDPPIQTDGVEQDARIADAALRLAVMYSEDVTIPTRFRPGFQPTKTSKRAPKKETAIERNFQEEISFWRDLMERMLVNVDSERAWRFIDCLPAINLPIGSVAQCDDFIHFVDYLILRRDVQGCDGAELGRLSSLLGSFQTAIERDVTKAPNV